MIYYADYCFSADEIIDNENHFSESDEQRRFHVNSSFNNEINFGLQLIYKYANPPFLKVDY